MDVWTEKLDNETLVNQSEIPDTFNRLTCSSSFNVCLLGIFILKTTAFLPWEILLVALLFSHWAAGADYVISVNESYEHKVGQKNMVSLFEEIYAPLGITPTLQFLPSLRGLQLANKGVNDAEAGRTLDIANNYENLLRVAYPIIVNEIGTICLTPSSCKLDPKLRYAVVGGLEKGKIICQEKKLNCLFDQSQSFLANAMINNAVDALMGRVATSTDILCQLGSKKIYYKADDNLSITSYHLIHKKHAALLPQLNESIRLLSEKGRIAAFIASTNDIKSSCKIDLEML